MAGLALLLISLWLMSEGRRYTWTLYPSIFMIVTDIAALLYLAYTRLLRLLPNATTTQATLAHLLVGIICLVLVVAGLLLAWDGWQAIQQARKKKPVQA